ncbi:Serine/threonine-protein kinase HRK1; AltName: Full=Hygromycin resistance kinase 1 [Serendipita indica DSM 11827]|uniref:non-specific serine/threonine protein kinase n=1 Tax=Serendipita indica (strain DSM 11827) TaxID=1109443 RepID=G4TRC4_SERID|nr:Serine/threonine-protein kinase HRK1; AltName: Full=Hygromycin resistance kinase 1 [Serendipita indica DSM 11827]CCA73867.1 related to serine/threonine protein kinase [Serendipita indica DSM 11827]
MPAPNAKASNPVNTTATAPGGQPGADEDAGGGESEPSNDSNKGPLNTTTAPTSNHSRLNSPNTAQKMRDAQVRSPRSPNRPQITLEITPATPKLSASSAVPPSSTGLVSPRSERQRQLGAGAQTPASATPGVAPSSSAHNHEAVQSWVQSQGTGANGDTSTNAHSKHPPAPSKRDSVPATPSGAMRVRRPSESSQKSAKDFPRPPSASGSQSGGEGKFSFKDLLSSGPKLSRRNSTSSKKSVSSGKGGSVKGGSTAGESAQLESKYGIYGKMAVGKGATSVVRLAHKWDRTEDKLYAVKEFRPRRSKESQRDYVKKLTSEFCISSALRHPNVVETIDLMQDQEGKWCEVMEYCAGGDLYNAIRKGGMSAAEVECSFKQILNGVGYLHGQGVAHRDIKPENLFFDARGQVKVGDFGASTVFRLPWEHTIHKSSGLCGSEPYIAPEQFTQPNSYDARLVDIWACGIVYYCLHFQELPWGSAQSSDRSYAHYAQQCATPQLSIANVPFLKTATTGVSTPITPGPGTPHRQDSSTATATLHSVMTPLSPSGPSTPSGHAPQSRAEREKEVAKENAAAYPSTIYNLSPRACRPVLRRMLEPKPELRVTIEDVLRHPWIQSIEVCTDPGVVPKHIHPAAIAAAAAGGIAQEK